MKCGYNILFENGYTCSKGFKHTTNTCWIKENDVGFFVVCFSGECQQAETMIQKKQQEEGETKAVFNTIPRSSLFHLSDDSHKISQEYLNIPFREEYIGRTIIISSCLATGKTQLIKSWVEGAFQDKNVLYISNRITLSFDIKNRIPSFHLYSDIEGQIRFTKKQKHIICQVESLARF